MIACNCLCAVSCGALAITRETTASCAFELCNAGATANTGINSGGSRARILRWDQGLGYGHLWQAAGQATQVAGWQARIRIQFAPASCSVFLAASRRELTPLWGRSRWPPPRCPAPLGPAGTRRRRSGPWARLGEGGGGAGGRGVHSLSLQANGIGYAQGSRSAWRGPHSRTQGGRCLRSPVPPRRAALPFSSSKMPICRQGAAVM